MKRLKIALTQGNYNGTSYELILRACEDPSMLELCTPIVYGCAGYALAYRKAMELATNFSAIRQADEARDGHLSIINAAEGTAQVEMGQATADALQQEEVSLKAALHDLQEGLTDALVLTPTAQAAACPADATEIIITEKAHVMPVEAEPTAEDITRLRDILERDFDLLSPRIAIVQESRMQNPELPAQATADLGINTYGPYTAEQILSEDVAIHFDGIITVGGSQLTQHVVHELSQEAPARFFAGREAVVTAVYAPADMHDAGKGVTELSTLTRPIFTAIDILRNRAFYDRARQNPLPKLFHDKREDRRPRENRPFKEENTAPGNTENTEQAS